MGKALSKEQILSLVEQAAAPVAASFGLEIWGLELSSAGRPLVRIYVDSPLFPVLNGDSAAFHPDHPEATAEGGVTIEQCAEISRLVGLALEVDDVFPDAWVLEVSSPGLERLFFQPAQLAAYKGRTVDVILWEPLDAIPNRRKFRGELAGVDGDSFFLRPEAGQGAGDADMHIFWQNVRKARLVHIFPDTSKPGSGKGASAKDKHTGQGERKSGGGGGKQA